MDNEKKKLLSDAKIFAQHIVIALDCLGETRAMNQIFLSPQHKDQYPIARHFYRTAYFAMQYRFQMEVAKLFDKPHKAKKFDDFKDRAYNAMILKGNVESKYAQLKQNAQKDIEEIRCRRNMVYAHSNKDVFNDPDIFLDKHPFDVTTIEKLLFVMLEICNHVIMYLTDDTPAQLFSANNNDDFVKLFGYETQAEKGFKEIMRKWGGI